MRSPGVLRGRRLTYFVPAFCCLVIIFDGYDVSVYGTTIPVLLEYEPWGLDAAGAGLIASLALVGLLLGSLLCGFATDVLGRKRMLILCSSWFSVCMLVCAAAPTRELFALFRFLGGLGLGGVIPVCIALTVEFAPPGRRYLFTAIGNAGFAVGAVISALLGIVITPDLGFRPMYAMAGVLLLLMPVAMVLLPESVDFLVAKGRVDEARAVALRYGLPMPDVDSTPAPGRSARRDLTRPPLLRHLALFGLAGFGVQVFIYGLNTWLPQIMRAAGYGLTSALAFLAALSAGAIVGSLVMSSFADRFGPRRVLLSGLGIGVVALAVLSSGPPTAVGYGAVVLAGVGGSGTAVILHVFAGTCFPPAVRASAVGTYLAISRVGSVVGPLALGWIVAVGLAVQWNFYALMVPTVLGVLAVLLLPRNAPSESTTDVSGHDPAAGAIAHRAA
ncbi:MFS transporter [Umezawaea endophytica]|uniref:MFS transporter n=1 Tax=Umezawaea endophytica TaxID=1654476 RepID=A0A9X2VTS3_9PSEU|nr:MFS transporter [Umezawaea endophytica]MCS7482509.1 MFS transporter [Umezawaea endophytica]